MSRPMNEVFNEWLGGRKTKYEELKPHSWEMLWSAEWERGHTIFSEEAHYGFGAAKMDLLRFEEEGGMYSFVLWIRYKGGPYDGYAERHVVLK